MMSFRDRIDSFARRPGDSDETSFSKTLILIVALSCCGCGLIWSALYLAVFGVGLTMALPLADGHAVRALVVDGELCFSTEAVLGVGVAPGRMGA